MTRYRIHLYVEVSDARADDSYKWDDVARRVRIHAVRWTGSNHDEIASFVGDAWPGEVAPNPPADDLIITTLEGDHRANPGDWIIRGVKGEFYPCKPDIFQATYDPSPDHSQGGPQYGPPEDQVNEQLGRMTGQGRSVCRPPACSAHPDQPAVSQNDMRASAMCAECYDEWLKLWKWMQ